MAGPLTRQRSRRTANACWTMRSRTGSLQRWFAKLSCVATCRRITSPSMGRCCRRGRRTRPTPRPLIPKPCCSASPIRKSNNAAAELSYMGHLLIENRSALVVDADLTQATGFAERDCATDMLRRLPKRARRRTVAGDKNDDTKDFVADVRGLGFTPPNRPPAPPSRGGVWATGPNITESRSTEPANQTRSTPPRPADPEFPHPARARQANAFSR
ncbi:MAG: hypothetical protein ACJAR2_002578 [Ilumatobacter sp.]|jgi:hypothetical protein